MRKRQKKQEGVRLALLVNLLTGRVIKFHMQNILLFRVVEIHRICETTATPGEEGASLSEFLEQ